MAFDDTEFEHVQITRPDHRGRVYLSHADRRLEIRVSWRTIDAMQKEWGIGAEFLDKAADAIDFSEISTLAFIMAHSCKLDGSQEYMTIEEGYDHSFPITPLRRAILASWQWCWNGGEVPEEDAAGKAIALTTWFNQLWKTLSGRESRSSNSGT